MSSLRLLDSSASTEGLPSVSDSHTIASPADARAPNLRALVSHSRNQLDHSHSQGFMLGQKQPHTQHRLGRLFRAEAQIPPIDQASSADDLNIGWLKCTIKTNRRVKLRSSRQLDRTVSLLSHHIWHTYLTRESAVCRHGEDKRHSQAERLVHQKTWGGATGQRDMHRHADSTKNLLQLVGPLPRTWLGWIKAAIQTPANNPSNIGTIS